MKMFKFHLQPVLNHRQFIEDALQKAYVHLKTRLSRAQDLLSRWELKKHDLSEELKQKQRQGTNSSALLLYINYLNQLSADIKQQQIKIRHLEEQTGQKREELLDAMKNRKALEKLKEKKATEHKDLLNKKEQAFLDEIGVRRHGRPNR
jgi:flagellar FliJ protein